MTDDELMVYPSEFDKEVYEIYGDFEMTLNGSTFGEMCNYPADFHEKGFVGEYGIMSELRQRMKTMINLLSHDFIRSLGYDNGGSALYFCRKNDLLTIKEVEIKRYYFDESEKGRHEYQKYAQINHIEKGYDWTDYIEPIEVRMDETVSYEEFIKKLFIACNLFKEEVYSINPLLKTSINFKMFESLQKEFSQAFINIL